MSIQETPESPPPWGDDPLSRIMSSASRNERVSALNWPDVFGVLQHAHGLLARVGEILEHDAGHDHLLVPRMLFGRSHSAVLAAMRLAMSGQAFEARPLLRLAIEEVWYALHIAKDPAPPARARIWWGRDRSPQSKAACRNEFTAGNVRQTHETLDARAAAAMQCMYEDTITFGAHPNERGVSASLKIDRSPDAVTVKVGVLQPDPLVTIAALKAMVDVAVGTAKTIGLIYPERFSIAGVDTNIDQLARHSAEVFGKRARALSSAS